MGKKRWKSAFRHGGRVENSKNCISATAETEKMTKIGFRPWPKSKKRQKLRFGHGRNWKNAENYISNPVEIEKCLKTALPPYEKRKNNLKTVLSPYGKQKDWCLKRIHTYYNEPLKKKILLFFALYMILT